jgi:hypothetical protein
MRTAFRVRPAGAARYDIAAIALIALLPAAQDASADAETGHRALRTAAPTPVVEELAHASVHRARLPGNLLLPEIMRPLAEAMWRGSPTFRRQCARLAQSVAVTVNMELDPRARHGRHAITRVSRHGPGLIAVVQLELRRPELYVESIAHELEHVLEQMDGLDLPRLAHQRLNGVVSNGDEYETARAHAVGRAVVREMASH